MAPPAHVMEPAVVASLMHPLQGPGGMRLISTARTPTGQPPSGTDFAVSSQEKTPSWQSVPVPVSVLCASRTQPTPLQHIYLPPPAAAPRSTAATPTAQHSILPTYPADPEQLVATIPTPLRHLTAPPKNTPVFRSSPGLLLHGQLAEYHTSRPRYSFRSLTDSI
jgi:hypothetical protein